LALYEQELSISENKEITNMNKIDRLGLSLYTVRAEMENRFEDTLREVAAIGYEEVEFAGYFEHTPKVTRQVLDRYSLTAPSAHIDFHSLESNWQQVVESTQIIGHKYIVISIVDINLLGDPDIWKRAADIFNRAGEFSKQAEIQLVYHNHYWEFFPSNGKLPYDFLLEACDPEFLKMELDFCWMAVVEQDPLVYFQRYPGRFPLVHLKQLTKLPIRTPEDYTSPALYERTLPEITEVGTGVIDWKRIFSQSTHAGIQHFFVEHDVPRSPFDSIKTSYDYLDKLRF
jgi:sugar phosphate isomerase/epimerase